MPLSRKKMLENAIFAHRNLPAKHPAKVFSDNAIHEASRRVFADRKIKMNRGERRSISKRIYRGERQHIWYSRPFLRGTYPISKININWIEKWKKLCKIPCKYGNSLHINSPNTKSLSNVPISVNGMHRTPSKISEMARLSRNTFVMFRMRRFWINVRMTRELPTMASSRMVAYSDIWMWPVESHEDGAFVMVTFLSADDVRFALCTTNATPRSSFSMTFDEWLLFDILDLFSGSSHASLISISNWFRFDAQVFENCVCLWTRIHYRGIEAECEQFYCIVCALTVVRSMQIFNSIERVIDEI